MEPTDLPYLYQWENDATNWVNGSVHNPLSQADLRDYISKSSGDIYIDGQLRLLIERDKITVGCVDLFDLDVRNRRAAIGMYIAPQFRGKNIGDETVDALEHYAFGYLHLRTLYAVISMQNNACMAIYAKAGYTPSSPLCQWTLEGDAQIWVKTNKKDTENERF